MDINQLKSFVAVAHAGHLTQAAESLHLSQPAVTAQIKAIEKNLDVQLFTRHTQGMGLTPAGQAFLPKAEIILQQMHELDSFAQSLGKNYIAEANLGIVPSVDRVRLRRLVELILQEEPGVYLNISQGLSGNVLNKVRKKELIGGFFLGDNPYRNVHAIMLERISFMVVVPQHREAELMADPRTFFSQQPWIDLHEFSAGARMNEKFWQKNKIVPKKRLRCDAFDACLELVAADLAIALLPVLETKRAIQMGKPVSLISKYGIDTNLNYIYPAEFSSDRHGLMIRKALRTAWDLPFEDF